MIEHINNIKRELSLPDRYKKLKQQNINLRVKNKRLTDILYAEWLHKRWDTIKHDSATKHQEQFKIWLKIQ